MNLEQKDFPSQINQLTETQVRTANEILGLLQSGNKTQRKLVVVEGLPGVGKTRVISSIAKDIQILGSKIVETEGISQNTANSLALSPGNLVTTDTYKIKYYSEKPLGLAQLFPDFQVTKVVLPGMDETETEKFLNSLGKGEDNSLSSGDITRYSLGIPLLVEELTSPGLNPRIALGIPIQYLINNIGLGRASDSNKLKALLTPYLGMRLDKKVLAGFEKMRGSFLGEKIYDDLERILANWKKLKEEGIDEESPLFVAPESEEIYNWMQKLSGNDRTRAEIEIFVPNLSPADLKRLQEAFGFSFINYCPYYSFDLASRLNKMFGLGIGYRKTGIWHRDFSENEIFFESECPISTISQKYLDEHRRGNLGLGFDNSGGYFVVHCHAHNGETYRPAQIGWATESLLQQRGLPYFVNNVTFGKAYIYDPKEKRLVFRPLLG